MDERPREKLRHKGVAALSDAELVAILLRSGTPKLNAVALSQQILADCEHNLIELSRMEVSDLLRYDTTLFRSEDVRSLM